MAEVFEAEFRLDASDALEELRELQTELENTQNETGNTDSGVTAMATSVTAAVAVFQEMRQKAEEVARAIRAAAQEFERQAGILNRFTGNVEEARRRTNGLITEIDLMIAQQRAAQAGLNLTAEQFATVAVRATEFAAATGGDATEAINQLSEALAQGREGALRRYGIDLEGVTDQAERQTEAVRQLEEGWGDAESSADTLAGRLDVLANSLDDAETELIRLISSSDTVNDSLAEMDGHVSDLVTSFGELLGLDTSNFLSPIESAAVIINSIVATAAQGVGVLASAIRALLNGDFEQAGQLVQQLGPLGLAANFQTNLGGATAEALGIGGAAGAGAARDILANMGGGGGGPSTRMSDAEKAEALKLLMQPSGGRRGSRDQGDGFGSLIGDLASGDGLALADVDVAQFDEGGGFGGIRVGRGGDPKQAVRDHEERAKEAKEAQDRFNDSLRETNQLAMQIGENFITTFEAAVKGEEGFGKALANSAKKWAKNFAIEQAAKGIGATAQAFQALGTPGMQPLAAPLFQAAAQHFAAAAAVGALGGAAGAAAGGGRGGGGRGGGGRRRPEASASGGAAQGGGTTIVNLGVVATSELGKQQAKADRIYRRRHARSS